ncbi:MAG: hypothetical protein JXB50_06285 [Spirochaetes bacterium]|nr:hypothetical protein [Spirochaetota bacterium]
MKIKSIINNPILKYRLDPGEPGLPSPTPASRSIAKVATHEATNIRRFKREAMQNGGIVVYSKIGLNLSYQGSFLAATSGKSEALIIYPIKKEKDKITSESISSNDQNEINIDNYKKTKNFVLSHESNNDLLINEEILKINTNIKNLENEKLIIEGEINNKKINNNKLSEKFYLTEQINKINSRIEQLKQKIKFEKINELLINLMNSYEITNKLLNLKYGNKNNIKNINTGTHINSII